MGNLKHTIAAIAAVSLVGSLAAVQMVEMSSVRADKMAQTIETVKAVEMPSVLPGDGEGETQDFAPVIPTQNPLVGKDAYVLTSGGSINLRAAADTESTILNVLELGTQVKVLDSIEDWCQIQTGDYTGYVKSEFLNADYNKVQEVMLATTKYQKGKVTQSVNVRGLADENSVLLNQVGEGSEVIVLEKTDNGWLKVYFGQDYDIGYISAQYTELGEIVDRKDINRKRTDRLMSIAREAKIKGTGEIAVKTLPQEESETIITLYNGSACKIVSGGTNWTKIIVAATNEIGYVKTSNVAEIVREVKKPVEKKTEAAAKSAKTEKTTKTAKAASAPVAKGNGQALVNQAAKYLGVKYVYGGSSPSGFDCSGLVQYCCKKLGVSVNRSARSQYSNGVAVSKSELQPGDLVFFSRGGGISHVVIYAGNGQVIHAPRTGKTVSYQSLDTICGYSKYVGARRVM